MSNIDQRSPVSLMQREKVHDLERSYRVEPSEFELQQPYTPVTLHNSSISGKKSEGRGCGCNTRKGRWTWGLCIMAVILALVIGIPVLYRSRKHTPSNSSSSRLPTAPDNLPTIKVSPLRNNSAIAVISDPDRKLAYQESDGDIRVAEYIITDDGETASLSTDYALAVQTRPKNDTPIAAVGLNENQVSIFYVAANNTIQSREGILALEELRSTSSLSTLGLQVHPKTNLAALVYPDGVTAVVWFQLPNNSLVSYHVVNNLWVRDTVLPVNALEGTALSVIAYPTVRNGNTATEVRVFYQDKDMTIGEQCGSSPDNVKWATCRLKSPKMKAMNGSAITSASIGSNGGIRTFYHSPNHNGKELMEVYWNGTAWAGPSVVKDVELEAESKLAVIAGYGENDDLALYFSKGDKLEQRVWRGSTQQWSAVTGFGMPPPNPGV
ncbi:hypothetical protein BDD12DRAFT_874772 [Trichophaea hybrida]|nr:hypothetical protein BDD12DRAFT_874772 [Trichophaea hybrida]